MVGRSEPPTPRALLLCAFALVAACGDADTADGGSPSTATREPPEDAAPPEEQDTPVSHQDRGHLDLLREAALTRELEPQRQAQLAELFERIDAERARLAGKSPWDAAGGDDLSSQPLQDALQEAVRELGIAIATAALLDTTGDDLARQAALVTLVEHERYGPSDLGSLCDAFLFVAEEAAEGQTPQYRGWLTPDLARRRLAAWIEHVLEEAGGRAPGAQTPVPADGADALRWLRDALEGALATIPDAEARTAVEACLTEVRAAIK